MMKKGSRGNYSLHLREYKTFFNHLYLMEQLLQNLYRTHRLFFPFFNFWERQMQTNEESATGGTMKSLEFKNKTGCAWTERAKGEDRGAEL